MYAIKTVTQQDIFSKIYYCLRRIGLKENIASLIIRANVKGRRRGVP